MAGTTKKVQVKRNKQTTKDVILETCVKLFLEQGYNKTTLSQIAKDAGICISSFQNVFGNKDGVLLELARIMFDAQFGAVIEYADMSVKPLFIYASETAMQITMTELNENLRDVYVAAYSNEESAEYIYKRTSAEIGKIFVPYNPECGPSDFYEYDIGSAGIMRGFMSRKCDQYFTLETKLRKFITMTLRAYNVPKNEIEEAIEYVLSLDIVGISNNVMRKLFETLAMQFHFELSEVEEQRY